MDMTIDPRLVPARPDLAAAHLKGSVAAERFTEGRSLTVAAPVLDMTSTPDRDAGLSNQLLMGERFLAYEEDAEAGLAWGQAEADGYVGYVSLAGLEADAPEPDMHVTVLSTYIYPEPNMKTRPLEALPMLARVATVGHEAGFVALASGGYCPAQHLAPIGPLAGDFVGVAEQMLGRPYLWGGRSAEGVDCSGFVQLALAAVGRMILRDADLQQSAGVELNEPLARGDLVFWDGHVGIMQDDETLLHANAHHMAVASEPLADAEARILKAEFGPILSRRRLLP